MRLLWIGLITLVGAVIAITIPYLLPLYALMALFAVLQRRQTGRTSPTYRAFVFGIAAAIIIYAMFLLFTLVTVPAA